MGDTKHKVAEDDWRSRWTVKRDRPGSLLRPTHLFRQLPPELRNMVFQDLDWKESRALRQVCRMFKWDAEQVVGLSVVIKDKAKNLRHNALWLQNVIVRRLDLVYVGRRVPYAEIRLKNPLMLRELTLCIRQADFNDPSSLENLKRIMNICNRVRSFSIILNMDILSDMHFNTIFFETLKCLGTKYDLKTFNFCVNRHYWHWKQPLLDDIARKGRGFRIMPDPTYEPKLQFPIKVSNLYVSIPIISRRDLLNWAAFLNTQDQLKWVFFNVGLVSWHLFETALRKSRSTLRYVWLPLATPETTVTTDQDLRLEFNGKCIIYNGPQNEEDEEEHHSSFDWSMLSQARLVKLNILSSYFPYSIRTIRSHNFDKIQLSKITQLDITLVHLTTDDLTRIFMEGESLSDCSIELWTLKAERDDASFCLLQSLRIWIVISIVLQKRRFKGFYLGEDSLRMLPAIVGLAVRGVIRARNKIVYEEGVIQLEPETV